MIYLVKDIILNKIDYIFLMAKLRLSQKVEQKQNLMYI